MDAGLVALLHGRYRRVFQGTRAHQMDVSDGWFELLDVLCAQLEWHLEQTPELAEFKVRQIKEKFGTLRVSYSGGDDFCRGVVEMATGMSGRICGVCGGGLERADDAGHVPSRYSDQS